MDTIRVGDRFEYTAAPGEIWEVTAVAEVGVYIKLAAVGTRRLPFGDRGYMLISDLWNPVLMKSVSRMEPTPEEKWAEHLRQEKEIAAKMAEHDRPDARVYYPRRYGSTGTFTQGHWEPSISGLAAGNVGIWRRR